MKSYDLSRADSLWAHFEVTSDLLAHGSIGTEPFLDALEAHAGDWMPTFVGAGLKRKRKRKYSRAAFAKVCKEGWDDFLNWTSVELTRPPSPEVRVPFRVRHDVPETSISLTLHPFTFSEKPSYGPEWSRRLIAFARAVASHYPMTHGLTHSDADLKLEKYLDHTLDSVLGRPVTPLDYVHAVHWLDVLGKPTVDALGRERVLSTPAHLVEELPTGSVLLVTHPNVADFATDEARQAQARALVHLRPELDFDTVLAGLREHSRILTPVEPRFDPDVRDLLSQVLDTFLYSERQLLTAEWNQRRLEADEWLPASAALPPDVPDPAAARARFSELAEDLVVIRHYEIPSLFKETPESLTNIDLSFWKEDFPGFYEREKVENIIIPAVGAYLGQVLVRNLDGRWVPRRNLDEAQVIVGDRAWLPFLRAKRYLKDRQSLLEYSLTKLYREAERHRGTRASSGT